MHGKSKPPSSGKATLIGRLHCPETYSAEPRMCVPLFCVDFSWCIQDMFDQWLLNHSLSKTCNFAQPSHTLRNMTDLPVGKNLPVWQLWCCWYFYCSTCMLPGVICSNFERSLASCTLACLAIGEVCMLRTSHWHNNTKVFCSCTFACLCLCWPCTFHTSDNASFCCAFISVQGHPHCW